MKKIVTLFSLLYLLFGLFLFATNGFSLNRDVKRYSQSSECYQFEQMDLDTNSELYKRCAQTEELRWSNHFSWITWQFLSDGKGKDMARYIPADVMVLFAVTGTLRMLNKPKSKQGK